MTKGQLRYYFEKSGFCKGALKAVCSNLGAISHRMTLDKSLTAILSRTTRTVSLSIRYDIHRSLWLLCGWLVGVYGELKQLSGRTLRQASLLSRAAARNSWKKYRAIETVLRQPPTLQGSRKTRGFFFFFQSILTVSWESKVISLKWVFKEEASHVKVFQKLTI